MAAVSQCAHDSVGLFDRLSFCSIQGQGDLDDIHCERTLFQKVANFSEELLSRNGEVKCNVVWNLREKHMRIILPKDCHLCSHEDEPDGVSSLLSPLGRILLLSTLIFPILALLYKVIYRAVVLQTLSIPKYERPREDVPEGKGVFGSSNPYTEEAVGKMTPRQFLAITEEETRAKIRNTLKTSQFQEIAKDASVDIPNDPQDWPFSLIRGISPRPEDQVVSLNQWMSKNRLPIEVLLFLDQSQIVSISPDALFKSCGESEEEIHRTLTIRQFFLENTLWMTTHYTRLLCNCLPTKKVLNSKNVYESFGGSKLGLSSELLVPLLVAPFFAIVFSQGFSIPEKDQRLFPQLTGVNIQQIRKSLIANLFTQEYFDKDRDGFIRELNRVAQETGNSQAFQDSLTTDMKNLLKK